MQYLLLFSPCSHNQVQAVYPFPAPPPPPPPQGSLSLPPSSWLAHTFATVVAVFITSVIGSAGCPQTLLLMRWCGGHQRTLSSSRHRVSQQPSPEKIIADKLQEIFPQNRKRNWKERLNARAKTKRNWQGTRLSRGQPRGDFLATWSFLDSLIWVHLTWRPQVGKERHVAIDVCFAIDETRASNVRVGAQPTAVRNRVHATACWYAGLLGACRRYNGSPRVTPVWLVLVSFRVFS